MNIEDMLQTINGEVWWKQSPYVTAGMIVAPANRLNYYSGGARHELRECRPIAYVHHEPQEPSDNYESTPVWFQNPNADASTHLYGDSDGDEYQCVPLNRAPIANGWTGDKPIPRFNDGGPEFGAYSLNQQTRSKEHEGFTHNIHATMTQAQYATAVDSCALFLLMEDLPRNPARVAVAHADVASNRTDGIWVARNSGIPQEAVKKVLKIEKDFLDFRETFKKYAVEQHGNNTQQAMYMLMVNARYEAHTAHPPPKA